MSTRVVVVGAGSWGTALASVLAGNKHDVTLWAREPDVVEQINGQRENVRFLPGVRLPDGIRATSDLAAAVQGAEFVVNVVPAQFCGRVMAEAAPHVLDGALIVSASKGIENRTQIGRAHV